MAWSTRQLAELAGTTVKTVRHYHALGLLEEPERSSNGYKQYQVAHLVRLLQIRRLVELGVPLSQIVQVGHAGDHPDEAIRVLDAELEATIERLQRVRAELSLVLKHRAALDVPPGFAPTAQSLSETDKALLMIYTRIFNEDAMAALREMMQERDAADDEFDALPADADEAIIRQLAEQMAPQIRRQQQLFPWMRSPEAYSVKDPQFTESVMIQAVAELYNPAQLKVLIYASQILGADSTTDDDQERD